MNALWLERMSAYRVGPCANQTSLVIINHKIAQQSTLLSFHHRPIFQESFSGTTLNHVLLYEARAAKHFWHEYATLVPDWALFHSRRARQKDITNILLDIGYHHLATIVKKRLEVHGVSLAPALFHVAQSETSTPLVYDLMELFRSDIVDSTVLTYLRRKKKPLTNPAIGHFVSLLNQALQYSHYLADFKQCHPYSYYLDLQLVKFIKAVNHKEVFKPLHLPTRHDTRCSCKNSKV